MRFTSNGYPQNLLFAFEYDTGTPSTENMTERVLRLDTFVDTVLTSTGADKVYLMGHSLGTYVSQTYLAVPTRAAKVAKYVNIDGAAAPALPGGVPTLALWATKGWSYNPLNQIVGATNVFIPNQTHVQIATSAESFLEMYKFFLGTIPATSNILSESCDQIQLAGRAMLYPQGRGVGDATLDIWEVNGGTGARIGAVPKATYTLSGNGFYDGAWGPFTTRCGVQYEFVLYRAGLRPHHFYFEPFVRDNYFVRLLTSPPGGIGDLMERNMNSAALVITRNKEFWGDQGANNDVLTLNGANVINAATCPLIKVPGSTGVIGIFAYDRYLNGLTDLSAPIPTFFAVGFMTGVDIYMPAADPPTGTISLVLTPRGGGGGTQVINMLNWASLNHSVSAPFNDFFQPAEEEEVTVPQVTELKVSPSLPPLRLQSPNMHLNNISISPEQTQAGQPVTVLANVVNSGASSGSYNVAVRINGKVEQQRTIEVSPGTAYPVRFTVTKSQPGTYDVAIENQKASFTVLGGTTSKAPVSGGLIVLIAMAVLILATAVVLMISFRRPA
jgi:pimeloyl-ACP methyl ester carboxylesterase